MSFFKTLAVIGIAIAMLPAERENQIALTQTALSVSAEARSFCQARPNICITREEAWTGFMTRASFAYDLGQELIWGQQATYAPFAPQPDNIGTLLQSELGDL